MQRHFHVKISCYVFKYIILEFHDLIYPCELKIRKQQSFASALYLGGTFVAVSFVLCSVLFIF